MRIVKIAIVIGLSASMATAAAHAGGLLGELLFGSLDTTQRECMTQNPGNYTNTWLCIRARVAQGHAGDMNNGPAMQYLLYGDLLASKVRARRLDDASALYALSVKLTQADLQYNALHPAPPDNSVSCYSSGGFTNCY
jgi:hypothetical protein